MTDLTATLRRSRTKGRPDEHDERANEATQPCTTQESRGQSHRPGCRRDVSAGPPTSAKADTGSARGFVGHWPGWNFAFGEAQRFTALYLTQLHSGHGRPFGNHR